MSFADKQIKKTEDHHVETNSFSVGDFVVTKYGLTATVTAVHRCGSYDIIYNDAKYGTDEMVSPDTLKHRYRNIKNGRRSSSTYTTVVVEGDDWVDHSAISSDHVVSRKRRGG
jgi:hypothetical protein